MDYCSKYNLPHLSIDYDDPDSDIRVVTDDHAGIQIAVDHLVSLGHTRIAHATDTLKSQYADVRFRAFCDAMQSRGLTVDESLCFHDYFLDDCSNLKLYAARIAAMKNTPTAIVCGSDYMAVKLLMILMQHGVRIPDDISIIGYGGVSVSKLTVPALTTIRQPFEEMAVTAVTELIKCVRKEKYQSYSVIDPQLIPGETTATAKTGRREER